MNSKETLTPDEKRRKLYLQQKDLLDTFLRTGAITCLQYEKSLGDLTEKMNMRDLCMDGGIDSQHEA